jgi:predicted  nucleic acid-binding Zn-ribbon protein
MESVSLPLPILLILLIIVFACVYTTWATNSDRAANEREFVESWEAKTSKQERKHQEQLKAAHDERDSLERVNGSLRHEISTRKNLQAPLVTKSGRQEREIERQRREIHNLREALEDATYSRSTVENADYVKEQWNSISGTLAKAGFVAKTPTDLARSIEKLLELRDSAVAPPNQASLDKKELAKEKAANEAALAKERAEMINDLQSQYNKEKDQMIKGLQGQYTKEKDVMIKELQGEYNQAVATEVNTQLNKHRRGELANEAAASAATEIESLKNHSTKPQKQLEQAHEATTQAKSELQDAKSTVEQKNQEIAALYNEARGAINERDAKIKALSDEITHMQNTATTEAMKSAASKTASGNLELELAQAHSKISQYETRLNNANKEIEGMRAERQRMMAERQDLLTQGQKLQSDLEIAGKQLQTQREQSNGGIATGTPQPQQLQMQLDYFKNELNAASKAAQKHKEEAQSLAAQLRSTNDDFEKLRVNSKKGNQQLRDCIKEMREHTELELAFEGKVKGVARVELRKIITDNCEEYRNARNDAEIDFDNLPVYVQYSLLAYMHKNKEVDEETENDDKSKVETKVEDRKMKTPKSRRNQQGGLQPQQQPGTPAPSNSFTFPPQSSNSQHGGFQSQQNGTPAPSNSIAFGAPQNSGPAASGSFTFGAHQNIIPTPSNSFFLGAQQNTTQAPSSTFNFGAQSSNGQQQHGTPAPSVPYTFDSRTTPFQ